MQQLRDNAQKTVVTYGENPLSPEPTEVHLIDFNKISIDEIIKEYPVDHILVNCDGKNLTVSEAKEIDLTGLKAMHVQVYAAGGGTNPVRAILSIALSFATFGIGTGAIFGLSGLGAAAAAAGVFVVGNLLINAIAPVEQDSADTQKPGEVFSIFASQNAGRAYQPVPLVLGTRRVYPDHLMVPYTKYEGNKQFAHILLSTGIGDLAYADIRIDKTHINEYTKVETEFVAPGENVTLFDDNVVTVQGAQLESTTVPITREFDSRVRKVEVDYEGTAFSVNDRGDTSPRAVSASAVVTNTDTNTVVSTTTHSISGTAGSANTPVRRTFSIDIPTRANHKITITRTTAKSANNRVQDNITVPSIRFFRDGPTDRSVTNKIAIRIQASEQLSGSINNINLLQTQLIRTFDNSETIQDSLEQSSNPAELIYAYAKGWYGGNQQLVGGMGLDDTQIDIENLATFEEYCRVNDLSCELYINTDSNHWDIIKTIAACGRGGPTFVDGRLYIIFDQGSVGGDVLSRQNVLEDSYFIDYVPPQSTPDTVIVKYDDRYNDYITTEIRKNVPGKIGTNVSTVTLNGVTNRPQAIRALNLIIGRQIYLNRIHSCKMGVAGFDVNRGQIVYVSNDLLVRSDSGRLNALTSVTEVVLDRTIRLSDTITNNIILKFSDGRVHRTTLTNTGDDLESNTMTLKDAIPAPSYNTQTNPRETLWVIYASEDEHKHKCRIISTEPDNDNTITVGLEDYVQEYEDSDSPELNYVFPEITYEVPKLLGHEITYVVSKIGDRPIATITVDLKVDINYLGALITQYVTNPRENPEHHQLSASQTSISFPALITRDDSRLGRGYVNVLISLIGGGDTTETIYVDIE